MSLICMDSEFADDQGLLGGLRPFGSVGTTVVAQYFGPLFVDPIFVGFALAILDKAIEREAIQNLIPASFLPLGNRPFRPAQDVEVLIDR